MFSEILLQVLMCLNTSGLTKPQAIVTNLSKASLKKVCLFNDLISVFTINELSIAQHLFRFIIFMDFFIASSIVLTNNT